MPAARSVSEFETNSAPCRSRHGMPMSVVIGVPQPSTPVPRRYALSESSGAWTRTRTTQLQRLVRCQLRYAGLRSQLVMGYRVNALLRYRPGSCRGIGRLTRPRQHAGRYPSVRLGALPCSRRPSLRSCGRDLRCDARRCEGIRDSRRPRSLSTTCRARRSGTTGHRAGRQTALYSAIRKLPRNIRPSRKFRATPVAPSFRRSRMFRANGTSGTGEPRGTALTPPRRARPLDGTKLAGLPQDRPDTSQYGACRETLPSVRRVPRDSPASTARAARLSRQYGACRETLPDAGAEPGSTPGRPGGWVYNLLG
jgi:hypothetical protein